MAKNVFSVPIFFIVFRETIEGAIILATLLGLARQIAYNTRPPAPTLTPSDDTSNRESTGVARRLKIRASLSFDACPNPYTLSRFWSVVP